MKCCWRQDIFIIKLGGLDGRDQSRSRSRTSFVSRLTFENRRDYPSRRDQLLKVSRSRVSIEISTKIEILGHKPCRDFVFWTVENVLHVETNFWKPSRMSIMSRSTFENRRDRESRSRPCRDKSRPPRLKLCHKPFIHIEDILNMHKLIIFLIKHIIFNFNS